MAPPFCTGTNLWHIHPNYHNMSNLLTKLQNLASTVSHLSPFYYLFICLQSMNLIDTSLSPKVHSLHKSSPLVAYILWILIKRVVAYIHYSSIQNSFTVLSTHTFLPTDTKWAVFEVFCSFFIRLFPYCWILRTLCTVWLTIPYQLCLLQIFSPSHWRNNFSPVFPISN